MKGDNDVIKGLNLILTQQLTAINQYFLHSRMLSDWGYEPIAKKVYKESIRQMKAAEKVTDRILFLEGLPNYQKLLKLFIGESATECLANDLKFCTDGRKEFIALTQLTLDKKDHGSREIMEDLLKDEELHIEWLETQNRLIQTLGSENYLSEHL